MNRQEEELWLGLGKRLRSLEQKSGDLSPEDLKEAAAELKAEGEELRDRMEQSLEKMPESTSCALLDYIPHKDCSFIGGLQIKDQGKGALTVSKLHCPEVDVKNLSYSATGKYCNLPAKTNQYFCTLSVNTQLCNAYKTMAPVKITRVQQPGQLVFYADGSGKGGADYRCRWHTDGNDDKTIPARHKGGANYVYGDLHAAWLDYEKFPSYKYGYSTYPHWYPFQK